MTLFGKANNAPIYKAPPWERQPEGIKQTMKESYEEQLNFVYFMVFGIIGYLLVLTFIVFTNIYGRI